jgi:hypothetical protein
MKNLITTLFISVCFSILSLNVKAGNGYKLKYDSLSCLQIEGRILNAYDGIDGECTVELICNDGTSDTIILKEGRTKFKFVLNKNSFYGLRISKAGYISKLISINTEMLTQTDEIYLFNFETSLMQEEVLALLNEDVIDFPVAIVHYDYESDSFSYSKEYTENMKKELHKRKHTSRNPATKIRPVIANSVASSPKSY